MPLKSKLMSFYYCFDSSNVHNPQNHKRKNTRIFHKTSKMAEIIKNITEGLSLTYIKYKKNTMQRAKNRGEKTSDQYEAVSKSNLRHTV